MRETPKAHRRDGNFRKNITAEHEGNRPLGKPKCKWEYNVKLIVKKQNRRVWPGLSTLG
jgi:hypothetical protein